MARSSTTKPKRPESPAKGAGWGGKAKGASVSRIKPGDPDGIQALRWDAANMAHKEEVAAQMRGVLYHVALAGEQEHSRISAADKLLDRIEGKPVQRQDIKVRSVNPDEMTDDELAAIAAGRGGAVAGAQENQD